MQLSTDALEQFKKMYKEKYKIQLTNQEAVEYGSSLIRLIKAVYRSNLPETIDIGTKKDDN